MLAKREDVAIVGMSGRFPDAKNIDEFWQNLINGVVSIRPSTMTKIESDGVDGMTSQNSSFVNSGAVIEDADCFDSAFFGINPLEATMMDPQQRILLECAWETMEASGYNPEKYNGRVGVFISVSPNMYFQNILITRPDLLSEVGPFLTRLLNEKDHAATRISYKLNFTGPSINVQTACSSSLVSIHLACQSLLSGESDLVLCGGSRIEAPLYAGYSYEVGGILSPDGRCLPFDKEANGTVFGNGVGMIAMKRLSDAYKDRDTIFAVVKGTAINNDGAQKVSIAAPSVQGQAEVIEEALVMAEIDPRTVDYVETHGTGTYLGDPIEIDALTRAYRKWTSEKGYCLIGSLKANIGHLFAGAGVAGVIKTALSLKNKKIPPSPYFTNANPQIDFENSPFFLSSKLSDWQTSDTPHRAAVSAFGVGGTNAHAVLEEAQEISNSSPSKEWQLLKLSARTSTAMDKATTNLVGWLGSCNDQEIADVAYTLQVGRKDFSHRRIAVCEDINDAIEILKKNDTQRVLTSVYDGIKKEIVFMFSGQGAQYPNMGLALYETEIVFREHVDRCSQILKNHLSFDLRDILFPPKNEIEQAAEKLKQTCITQPALFTIEYSLAKLWLSLGVRPDVMVGHSIGEYVAACLAGVFSLEDALSIVAKRGELIQGLPHGSMLAVFLSEKEIREIISDELDLAVINGPSICALSGEEKKIIKLEDMLKEREISSRRLHTSHAFHSRMMEPILDPFRDVFKNIEMKTPDIPFMSNVSGNMIKPEEAVNPEYWVSHLRNTVRFSNCLEELFKEQNRIFLEVGPGNTLASLTRQHPNLQESHSVLSSIRHPNEKISDRTFLLRTIGQVWLNGQNFEWEKLYKNEIRKRIPLPTYPFERKRYWVDPVEKKHSMDDHQSSKVEECSPFLTSKEIKKEDQPENQDHIDVNDVEKTIINIWKKLLGYRQIDINDNYFELGGNSLMAVRMFTQIENIFGKRLPLATLYKAPTIRKLAAIISEEKYVASWASLVKIQPSGSRPPFFCMHAEGGNVLEYRLLSNYLGNDQPFYGLQAKGLEGKNVVKATIEEMAADYIREIKTIQPKGPYFIGGYCLGGLLAFEMAHQLQRNGEEVAPLILVSTSTPDHLRNIRPNLTVFHRTFYNIMERIELEIDNVSFLSPKRKIIHIIDRAIRTSNLFKYKLEDLLDKLFAMLHLKYKWHTRGYTLEKSVALSDDAYMAYHPKPLKNEVHLIRVSMQRKSLVFNPALGWQGLAESGLHVYEVKGFHKNILKEPHVQALAVKLNELLINAQTKY